MGHTNKPSMLGATIRASGDARNYDFDVIKKRGRLLGSKIIQQ